MRIVIVLYEGQKLSSLEKVPSMTILNSKNCTKLIFCRYILLKESFAKSTQTAVFGHAPHGCNSSENALCPSGRWTESTAAAQCIHVTLYLLVVDTIFVIISDLKSDLTHYFQVTTASITT